MIDSIPDDSRLIPSDVPTVAVLVTEFVLNKKEDLEFILQLEEKTLIPKYGLNGHSMDGTDRALICKLIMKNLLKKNPEKQ